MIGVVVAALVLSCISIKIDSYVLHMIIVIVMMMMMVMMLLTITSNNISGSNISYSIIYIMIKM